MFKWWWVQLPSDNSKSSSASFSRISSGREPRSTIKSVIILLLQRCYVWCMWWVRLLCVLLRYFFFRVFSIAFRGASVEYKNFQLWWMMMLLLLLLTACFVYMHITRIWFYSIGFGFAHPRSHLTHSLYLSVSPIDIYCTHTIFSLTHFSASYYLMICC